MPAISPEGAPLVLVSGANGYIAMHVIQALLQRGYRVRGTVRSESKIPHIRTTFAAFSDKLEIVVVEDITVDGAFEQVLLGVDAVAHLAAHVSFEPDDPQELIVPAVNGTVGVMKDAMKKGMSVKRVVYTSSSGAIAEPGSPPRVYTEENWNNVAVEVTEAKGREAPGPLKYMASKVLAEKDITDERHIAAWALYEESKATSGWDFVAICPPWVYGPFIHEHVDDASKLNGSLDYWYKNVVTSTLDDDALVVGESGWIDVRDVALSVVLALETPAAGGERIIVCAGEYVWQDFLDAAHARPSPYSSTLRTGKPGSGLARPGAVSLNAYNTSKAARVLDQGSNMTHPWRSMEDCVADMLAQFGQYGWGL